MTLGLNPVTAISIIDRLQSQSGLSVCNIGYCFVADGIRQTLTYVELDAEARSIAGYLRSRHAAGDRVLLIYPPGLDFIRGFFGCLYAGLIAVPVYPPRRNHRSARLATIIQDAEAVAVLTHSKLVEDLANLLGMGSQADRLSIYASDRLPVHSGFCADVKGDDIAFLQYTSGSTGQPKGVMVSHGNLWHNLGQIHDQFGHSSASRGVIWLPPYHDMGLIGGILQPLYGGFSVTLSAPVSFLQKPLSWLDTISRDRGTTSGGPNFAYELCIEKITTAQIAALEPPLDLSSWQTAFIGAEPIRAETIERFTAKFAPYGFDRSAFYPCYGLAEATLYVTGRRVVAEPRHISCGRPSAGQTVKIINPSTSDICPDGTEGEIWITGTSVAQGYWRQPAVSQETFGATLADDPNAYLRSGDLGIMQQGELHVTGRIKDLIVLRGQNYHPQDIEPTVEQSHPDLASHATAAFGCDINGTEQLIVVQEIQRSRLRSADLGAMEMSIRSAISTQHQLQVKAIILLKPGSIPKTSSGKIQRHLCKVAYQQNKFQDVQLVVPQGNTSPKPTTARNRTADQKIADQKIHWLRDYAQHHLNSRLIDERRTIPPYVVLDFGNQGLLGMQVAKQYGGLGLSHRSTLRILQQLGAIDPTLALFVGLNNVLGIRPIAKFASAKMQAELLPILATGRELAAFALTEPGAGSNPQAMQSQAIPHGNGYQLNGTKIWSGSAAWAGVINVFVQQFDRAGQPIGITAYALRRGTPGLRQGPEALTMGMRGMIQNAVYLENVSVHDADRLGANGAGMAVAQDAMMYGRIAIAAACVGGMKRCAQLMLRYAAKRSIASGRLLEHPILRYRLAEVVAMSAAVETLIEKVGDCLDRDITIPPEVYAASKITAPEYYWQAADWLVQSLGGRGYIEPNMAAQILRDARVLRIFEGPTETLCGYLGAIVVQQPDRLVQSMRETLQAPRVADRFEQAMQRFRQRHRDGLKDPDQQRWLLHFLGDLTAIAVLWAALEDSHQVNALLWAQQQFEQKLTNLMQPTPALMTDQAVAHDVHQYIDAIGDIEQTMAGEDHLVDPDLRSPPTVQTSMPPSQRLSDPVIIEPPIVISINHHQKSNLQNWLTDWLSQKLNIPRTSIDRYRAFADYGIDSVMAVELAQALEDTFALPQPLEPTIAWNFPTIAALANYLSGIIPDAIEAASADATAEFKDLSTADLADLLAQEIALNQAGVRS